ALLGAYSKETRRVNRRLVRSAAAEIKGIPYRAPLLRWAIPVVGVVAVAVIAASAWPLLEQRSDSAPAEHANIAAGTGAAVPAIAEARTEPVTETAPEPEPRPETDAEPAAEPGNVPEATLDQQLLLAGELTRLAPAFRVLFDLWNLEFDEPVTNGCELAQSAGYACLMQRGSWSSLRLLDRPAILTLTDSRGKDHHVVLEALQGDTAQLSIAGVTVTHGFLDVTRTCGSAITSCCGGRRMARRWRSGVARVATTWSGCARALRRSTTATGPSRLTRASMTRSSNSA
ncbi:MAG: hypothetical protein GWO02_22455, partial [Gammaproteobacteria bacterium]|nr:hypothetical protein [Gammaproteobacteria bacterium]